MSDGNSQIPDGQDPIQSDAIPASSNDEAVFETRSLWRLFKTTPISDAIRGRLSGRLDERALISESELPIEVKNRIQVIVRLTRLWRTEKVCVAGELLAHFGDGQDAGFSPEGMMANFGDVKTTAKLIRRAKRRCRPLPWHVMRRVCQATSISISFAVATYLIAAIYYASGELNVAVDFRNEINQPAISVPENERAWPYYHDAIVKIAGNENSNFRPERFASSMSTSDSSWGEAVLFLEENREAIATSRIASSMPHLGRAPYLLGDKENRELRFEKKFDQAEVMVRSGSTNQSLGSMQMPHLLDLQKLSLLLSMDALYAAEKGDGKRAVADVQAAIGMAKQLQENRIATEQYTALESVHHALNATAEILRSHSDALTVAQLGQLAHVFADTEILPPFDSKMTRVIILDKVQRIYTDRGNGAGRLTPEGFKNMMSLQRERDLQKLDHRSVVALLPIFSRIVATRQELTDELDSVLASYETHAKMPFWDSLSQNSDFSKWRSTQLEYSYYLRYMTIREEILSLDSMYLIHQTEVGRLDGVIVGIGLKAFRRNNNVWPKTLKDLVPEFLPSVPNDRFTGEPLRYRIADGEVVVYSVSHNRRDDGGQLPSEYQLPNEPRRTFLQRMNSLCAPHFIHADESFEGDWILWRSEGWKTEEVTQ